jgi:hypothetical protein
MLINAIIEVLAPFSAYIKTLEIEELYNLSHCQLHPFPQLDFRALQYLSLSDEDRNYRDFMIHILNMLQKSVITPVCFRFTLHAGAFQPILSHSVISNALELEVNAGKISICRPYLPTEASSRL